MQSAWFLLLAGFASSAGPLRTNPPLAFLIGEALPDVPRTPILSGNNTDIDRNTLTTTPRPSPFPQRPTTPCSIPAASPASRSRAPTLWHPPRHPHKPPPPAVRRSHCSTPSDDVQRAAPMPPRPLPGSKVLRPGSAWTAASVPWEDGRLAWVRGSDGSPGARPRKAGTGWGGGEGRRAGPGREA